MLMYVWPEIALYIVFMKFPYLSLGHKLYPYPAYINNFIIQFLAKNILSPPKPSPFSIHSSLYRAAFPLIILTDLPLNLVSSKQQMSTDLCSNIPTSSPELPLRVPTFALKTRKSANLLSRISHWMTVWLGLHLTLVLLCIASSLWKFLFHLCSSDSQ